jgi:hypothetical protein
VEVGAARAQLRLTGSAEVPIAGFKQALDDSRQNRHSEDVVLPWHRVETGAWFHDAQRPERRMRVAWHPDRRVAVLSLWDGNACSATFRLPIEDASALSQILVGFLGDCVQSSASPPQEPRSWLSRLRRRFRPVLADVIELVERRR